MIGVTHLLNTEYIHTIIPTNALMLKIIFFFVTHYLS